MIRSPCCGARAGCADSRDSHHDGHRVRSRRCPTCRQLFNTHEWVVLDSRQGSPVRGEPNPDEEDL
jgi:transcriptional regulator NrdR family protein